MKVLSGYAGGTGTAGLVYRFIGTSGSSRNLGAQNYTTSSEWERVLPTRERAERRRVAGRRRHRRLHRHQRQQRPEGRAGDDRRCHRRRLGRDLGGFAAGVAVAGAGAVAQNVVLTKTNAFIQGSKVTQATNVDLDASGTASISALVASLSAAVGIGVGGAGFGASIGLSIARNFIGFDPSGPTYTCTSPACYTVDRRDFIDHAGQARADRQRRPRGRGLRICRRDDADEREPHDPGLHRRDALEAVAPNAAEVQAYVKDSSISASGALTADAVSSQAIAALVVAALGGGRARAPSRASASAARASSPRTGSRPTSRRSSTATASPARAPAASTSAASRSTPSDTSAIGAFAGAASVAFALGAAAGVSISIGVALARTRSRATSRRTSRTLTRP